MEPDSRLLVFAKYPRAGRVKTRLLPDLTPNEAADLYRAFLCDSLATYVEKSARFETHLMIADERDKEAFTSMIVESEVASLNEIDRLLKVGIQSGDDLGERLSAGFGRAFYEASGAVCAIGTDHPTLPDEFLLQAFDLLGSNDLVIGPAADGGYYLIGMNQLYPSLFQSMPWSQETLFGETIREAERLNLSIAKLPEWYDVDDVHSLFRLAAEPNLSARAPRTADILRTLNVSVGKEQRSTRGEAK
ncbi:MAG: TIGR04282 family arsenosugar biosynthesis glycosyltransferase [Ignavibacteriae bacterium]|nr:TIGR04282 family arsenosugar biosynthesis glycosyltransferase [Ignavibacteriota bacterium]MCB9217107.1 TIGR04282 family arsenosugar biosynthesis glycosyltransferase [Ignavibacteria bacterium]